MLHFSFYEPVYYRIDSSEPDLNFPSSSNENKGYWVVFADIQGDRLTWRILTEDTKKIIIRSGVRSALRTTTNQCLASPSGEGTTLPFPIPYPQQSTNSLPLDPLDESTNRSLLPSGGLMADVPCLDHSLDGFKGYPDDVQTTKHARRMHAWSRCARTSLGAHVSPFGASSACF